jgi:hypothetical protein
MKLRNFFFILFATVILVSSCKVHPPLVKSNGKVPPGQAKKVTGEKSAKSYAPGQQKKAATPAPQGNGQKKKK